MTAPCNRCGMALSSTMLICPRCGNRPVPGVLPASSHSPGLRIDPELAGFLPRVAAFLIDLVVVTLLSLPLMAIFPLFTSLLVWWLYTALMEASKWQATLGKQALGLKVTDVNGVRIFFGRASARFFAKFLCTATLGIGFLMVLWTRHKQGLHDLVSGCLVYRRPKIA